MVWELYGMGAVWYGRCMVCGLYGMGDVWCVVCTVWEKYGVWAVCNNDRELGRSLKKILLLLTEYNNSLTLQTQLLY
jgi:hypothetical protein